MAHLFDITKQQEKFFIKKKQKDVFSIWYLSTITLAGTCQQTYSDTMEIFSSSVKEYLPVPYSTN